MARRARGYAPLDTSAAQDALLDELVAFAHKAGEGCVAVFDLDGCLFDTRPRQVQIFRELASRRGWWELYRVEAEHIRSWDLREVLRNAGIEPERIAELYKPVRRYWWRHFFTSEYLRYDHAMPGAAELVRAVHGAGLYVVYLTGRDETMRPGTLQALRRFGFPIDLPRTALFFKPEPHLEDTRFKAEIVGSANARDGDASGTLAALGEPVLFFDNEPANVNLYRSRFPEARVVFVETDHSPRPVEPHPEIPWLRGFLRTGGQPVGP